jgi:hypothetical protein
MHQLRPENLQPFAQFIEQVTDFFFDLGSLVNLIADLDVHLRPRKTGGGSREALRPTYKTYKLILHPQDI